MSRRQLSLSLPTTRRGHRVGYRAPMRPPYKFRVEGTCWIWLGATVTSRSGEVYGVCRNEEGKQELVHRFMYRKYKGPIPAGHDVHHVCMHTLCGHASHLQTEPAGPHRSRNGKHGGRKKVRT